jgi:hypothetical protein
MLGALPGVVPLNEPLIGAYLGAMVADYRGIRIEDLDVSNFTFERQRRGGPDQFFSPEFRAVWSPRLGKLIRARFLAHVAAHPPSAPFASLVVKEPNGSQAADLLLDALPRSRAIFLLRDGRDVVDSEVAAMVEGGWLSRMFTSISPLAPEDRMEFVVRSASRWLWRTQVVQDAVAHHPAPTLTLRYEECRAEPLSKLREVCSWLGLDVLDARLQAAVADTAFERVPADGRGPQEFHRAATPGMWKENLSADEQDAITRVIGAKLRELGYEV